MSIKEVADRLVQLCREGKNKDAVDELYSENIVSKEPKWASEEATKGIKAVREKTDQWINSVEQIHSVEISDPVVSGTFFSCGMDMDITFKERGRMALSEIAVYEVKDGKIISDEFFYNMPA